MQPKISVIVPTFKRPQLLKNCVLALSHQTIDASEYEVIVVSDGPDKETADMLLAFFTNTPQKVRYLSLPKKKGPAAARNLGWKNANGTLIAFTDDDCLPDPNWLENIWRHYDGRTEMAFTGKVIVPVSQKPTDFELNTKGLETGEFVTANCVVPKATLEAVDGFDAAFTAAWREDSDLQFKLLQRNVPIIKLNDAIVIHPVRKAPWGVSIKEQKKTMFNALLFKKYPKLYRERVKKQPTWKYYFTVLFFMLFILATIFNIWWLLIIALMSWIALTVWFITVRLSRTRTTFKHVVEMIVTSIIIPFLSIYWTIYGAIKYRVLFF
jgi:glycosyltransferase involved in cell wall biosynthesis